MGDARSSFGVLPLAVNAMAATVTAPANTSPDTRRAFLSMAPRLACWTWTVEDWSTGS
ncbi:hypothetical protein BH18ACT13_BH18ACT13_10950 [soil metagenome]